MRCSCAAGTMLSPRRTGREIATLPDGFPAVPSQRLSRFLTNSIDKSLSHRHSCRAVAGKHHGNFRRKKTRKEGCAFCVQSNFSCLSKFSVIQFSQVIRRKDTLCDTNGYSSPYVHSHHTESSVHNLVSPYGGRTISDKYSIIILRPPKECIYT